MTSEVWKYENYNDFHSVNNFCGHLQYLPDVEGNTWKSEMISVKQKWASN